MKKGGAFLKKLWMIFTSAALCLALIRPVFAAGAPETSTQTGILLHADTGAVLWEKDADRTMGMASTTKIMTALVALEEGTLTDTVTIRPEWTAVEGSSMYLKPGERYTLEELLYGMMLSSGNDAATAVACHIAGDEAAFAEKMNEKAKALGLTGTSFENPHGLDGEKHYSTARDLAALTVYAMENPDFARIVGTRSTQIRNETYVNHNKLLWRCEGVLGVKTGYTKASGRTLVSCCERNGTRYVCVTLNDPEDWKDHQALYDWAYDGGCSRMILAKAESVCLPVVSASGEKTRVYPVQDVQVRTMPGDEVETEYDLPRFVFPGVKAGERAGELVVRVNGEERARVEMVYGQDLPLPGKIPLK